MLKELTTKDFAKREYLGFPRGWIPECTWDDAPDVAIEDQVSPNLKAILMALAAAWKESDVGITGNYDILQYLERQSRIATATDFWLDLIARDFTGSDITRHQNESDDSFRHRLQIEILRPKGTRSALECGVSNLTGYAPKIIEPMNPQDCGAYGAIVPNQEFVLAASVANSPSFTVVDPTGIQVGMTIGGQDAPNDTPVVVQSVTHNFVVVAPYLTAPAGRLLTAYNAVAAIGYGVAGAYGSINNNSQRWVSQQVSNNTKIVLTDGEGLRVGMLISGGLLPTPVQIMALPNPNVVVVNTPVTLKAGSELTAYDPAKFGAAYQMFVDVIRPDGEGIPYVAGYSTSAMGYSTIGNDPLGYYGNNRYPPDYGYGQYCGLSQVQGNVTDSDIYKVVSDSVPAGVTAWTRISSILPPADFYVGGIIGVNTYFGYSCFYEPDLQPQEFAVTVVLPFVIQGSLNVSHFAAKIYLPFRLTATMHNTRMVAGKVILPFKVTIDIGVRAGVSALVVLPFKVSSTVLMGNQEVTYLNGTPPFVVGQSYLTPPGGQLGATFVLGYSRLGIGQYGY